MGKNKRSKAKKSASTKLVSQEIKAVPSVPSEDASSEVNPQKNSISKRSWEWGILLLASIFGYLYLTSRMVGIYVSVLKDEYIYVLDAHYKEVSGFGLPNELFQFVYSSTASCGPAFYDCARGISSAFVVGAAIFVYLITKSVTGGKIWLAALGYLATIFGSLATYATYFMPEAIFNFLMLAFVYLLIRYSQSANWIPWLSIGAIYALASISKPHAFFVLPAVILFIGFAARAGGGRFLFTWIKRVSVFVVTLFALNFLLSWLSARNQPTNVFGTYGAAVSSPEAISQTLGFETLSGFPGTFFGQLLLVTLATGLAFPVALSFIASILKKSRATEIASGQVAVFFGLAISNMIVVTALFEAWAGLDFWMHTRYYSYLIPLAPVVLAEAIKNNVSNSPKWINRVFIGAFLLISAVALVTAVAPYNTKWVDAPDLKFHIDNPLLSAILIVASALAAMVYLFSRSKGLLAAFLIVFSAHMMTGNHIFNYLHSTFGGAIVSDDISRILRTAIPQDELDKTVLLGPGPVEMDRALFSVRSGLARAHVVDKESPDLSVLKPDDQWVVRFGDIDLSALGEPYITGLGYSIYNLSDSAGIQTRAPIDFQLSSECPDGQSRDWACGPSTDITWPGGLVGGSVIDVIFEVSAEAQEVQFGIAGAPVEGTFTRGTWSTTLRVSGEGTIPGISVFRVNQSETVAANYKLIRLLHLGIAID